MPVLVVSLEAAGSAECLFSFMNRLKTDLQKMTNHGHLRDPMTANRFEPGLARVAEKELGEWIAL